MINFNNRQISYQPSIAYTNLFTKMKNLATLSREVKICKKVLYLTYYFTSEGKYNLYSVLFTDVILSMVIAGWLQNYMNMYMLMVSSKYKDLIAGLVIGF